MITKNGIKKFIEFEKRLKNICTIRGKQKLNALGKGFGRRNAFDYFNYDIFAGEPIICVTFYDRGYDLKDTCDITLTYDEVCMSDIEFYILIEDIQQEKLKKEQEELKKRKDDSKAKRKAEYDKLKKEFG